MRRRAALPFNDVGSVGPPFFLVKLLVQAVAPTRYHVHQLDGQGIHWLCEYTRGSNLPFGCFLVCWLAFSATLRDVCVSSAILQQCHYSLLSLRFLHMALQRTIRIQIRHPNCIRDATMIAGGEIFSPVLGTHLHKIWLPPRLACAQHLRRSHIRSIRGRTRPFSLRA